MHPLHTRLNIQPGVRICPVGADAFHRAVFGFRGFVDTVFSVQGAFLTKNFLLCRIYLDKIAKMI